MGKGYLKLLEPGSMQKKAILICRKTASNKTSHKR